MNRGVFLVRFTNVDDREKAIEEEVQMFDRNSIVVKPWKTEKDITKEKIDRVPI